jgi:hypothetical protein
MNLIKRRLDPETKWGFTSMPTRDVQILTFAPEAYMLQQLETLLPILKV